MTSPTYINKFSTALLSEFYMQEGDTVDSLFKRAAYNYLPKTERMDALGGRILDYVNKGWFMFSSPVLSNAPKERHTKSPHMNISCFIMDLEDSVQGQIEANQEMAALSVSGGGIGMNSEIRAVSKKAPGAIPYFKTVDSAIGYYKQAGSRRGSCAIYMEVSHPDIMEFIKIRIPAGDSARKIENRKQVNNAVTVTDAFRDAVLQDLPWELKCPATGEVREILRARHLWETILDTRALTGEPYIFFKDRANDTLPKALKDKGLQIKSSNLCSEVLIPTDKNRTAVCCLSSLNVEYFDEWKSTTIVEDAIEFLDCMLQYFIDFADPKYLSKAIYSATMGRDLGLGAMGFHYYLQKNGIPFESGGFGSAVQANHKIFSFIEKKAIEKSIALGNELGHAPDLHGGTELRRNVNLLAIAPNSNSGIILQTSPSIDPLARNSFAQTTRAGTYQVRNKYFQRLLDDKGLPPNEQEAIWKSVDKSHGSVQHLEFLSDEEKTVFKTAYEIDQHWVVQHAEDRAPYLTQAQPVNLFFTAGTDKSYFNSVHLKALKSKTLKTLYYCRMERAQAASHTNAHINAKKITDWSVEECISCSG